MSRQCPDMGAGQLPWSPREFRSDDPRPELRPGVKYQALARVLPEGGTVEIRKIGLRVSGAKAVTILIAAETDYNHISPLEPRLNDRLAKCRDVLDNAEKRSYQQLRDRSVKDHQSYFNRATLDLGATDPKRLGLTTAQRLEDFAAGPPSKFSGRRKYELSDVQDPDLIEDLFQMGRYLLICCSRVGTLPPGLGGIWMGDYDHTWNNDFHTDINFQQNFWHAELTNLSDLHEPFITFTDDIRKVQGKRLAGLLGCRGFALTHTTDAWKFAALFGHLPQWAFWPMGGVWNCSHVMEHYHFTQDEEYLEKVGYPLLRDNTHFLLDWLIFDEQQGTYVTSPSVSPEHSFTFQGQPAQVAIGSAMDQMLCYESFVNFLHASKVLGIEDGLTEKVDHVLKKLSRPSIGSDGRVLEWGREDLVEHDPRHRHLSHLYGVDPGCEITPEETPELAEAAMKSLAVRTGNHVRPHGMGFVRGHLLNLYARLYQADYAYRIVLLMVKDNTMDSVFHNMGSNHILMDGQGAWTAGIAEMLLQSHGTEHVVRLLPALPDEWKHGSFSGLCARGGFDIDLTWKQGRPVRASVLSKVGAVFRMQCTGANVVTCGGEQIDVRRDANSLVSFETDRGKVYEISFE